MRKKAVLRLLIQGQAVYIIISNQKYKIEYYEKVSSFDRKSFVF